MAFVSQSYLRASGQRLDLGGTLSLLKSASPPLVRLSHLEQLIHLPML